MAIDAPTKTCSRCGEAPAGSGGILCPPCADEIKAAQRAAWPPPAR
jgi:hypothetical protein